MKGAARRKGGSTLESLASPRARCQMKWRVAHGSLSLHNGTYERSRGETFVGAAGEARMPTFTVYSASESIGATIQWVKYTAREFRNKKNLRSQPNSTTAAWIWPPSCRAKKPGRACLFIESTNASTCDLI